ncbi:hypothetical protein DPMN_035970 [Dreissena polymorpha]|uniref:Uncharacterized protein n=1 Tax=Dreissena polymorpha TaxID=45954 RepID=A0A9D4MA55_DREPO|nr:hypothetical protein DPMN_035970 [Dreissena polymorpha]
MSACVPAALVELGAIKLQTSVSPIHVVQLELEHVWTQAMDRIFAEGAFASRDMVENHVPRT